MQVFFFDSSALVKRYVREAGSDFVTELTERADLDSILIARITQVEVIAAICRRSRSGSVNQENVQALLATFRQDIADSYNFVEISAELLDRAAILAESYGLRGYDAVQLATSIEANSELLNANLSALTLISADRELNTAASAEGLVVENPDDHP